MWGLIWTVHLEGSRLPRIEGSEHTFSKIDKNSETDTGVQPEGQQNKTGSHWLLPLPQSKNGDPASRNPQDETVCEGCILINKA